MSIDGKWIKENETKEFNENEVSKKQSKNDKQKQRFDELIKIGCDRAFAYKMAYSLSYSEAQKLADKDTIDSLISCGVSKEVATEIVNNRNKKAKRIR